MTADRRPPRRRAMRLLGGLAWFALAAGLGGAGCSSGDEVHVRVDSRRYRVGRVSAPHPETVVDELVRLAPGQVRIWVCPGTPEERVRPLQRQIAGRLETLRVSVSTLAEPCD